MNKRNPAPVLPPFADYRTRFLRELKSRYWTKPLVWMILSDNELGERCAALLWPCVNGSSAKSVATSQQWRAYWESQVKAALVEVQNLKAVINVYTNLDKQPGYLKLLTELRSDLQNKQGKRTALKSKWLGRDLDWTAVLNAKEALEPLVDGQVPIRANPQKNWSRS